jgi:5-methylthioribose kinase
MTTITTSTAADYLDRKGLLNTSDTVTARTLGGGVSNRVVEVSGNGDCFVLKQPLENLDVADDWPAALVRIHNEAAAARAYAAVLDGITRASVPTVVFESETDHVAVFDCAPSDAVTWKRHLLEGTVDRSVAGLVGEVLGTVHVEVCDDETLAGEFADTTPFEQLRLDPYHRTVARRHPEVADRITAELARVRGVDRTLVHGDYSPKNVLVTDETEPDVWILDFEVAHWGDPAFDVAFMLNHLFIKSVHNAGAHGDYVAAARRFWDRYSDRVHWDVERDTVRELAILMLARVDGTSPVEYVDDSTAAAIRSAALAAIRSAVDRMAEFISLVDAAAEDV